MPNMRVFRPADAVETAGMLATGAGRHDRSHGAGAVAAKPAAAAHQRPAPKSVQPGGYELVAADGEARVSLYASGSEVEIAVAAQKELAGRGIATRVVSVPSLELLLAQPADRRKAIIGNAPVKIAIEAAVRFGWDAVIGPDGDFIGMHSFGASAPAKDAVQAFRDHGRGGGRGCVKAPESRS